MDRTLFNKLKEFEIGSESDQMSFVGRLAQENGWSLNYAKDCVLEYKKFIYLVSQSEIELTPSDQVDQVWHLHLSYTKSYWEGMCDIILGRDLHHHPTKGGAIESERFKQQYQQTKAIYEQTFGKAAPKNIWPSVKERFDAQNEFKRINVGKYRAFASKVELILIAIFYSFVLVACVEKDSSSEIWFYLKCIFGAYIVFKIVAWLSRNGGRGSGGGMGCGGGGCGGCGG